MTDSAALSCSIHNALQSWPWVLSDVPWHIAPDRELSWIVGHCMLRAAAMGLQVSPSDAMPEQDQQRARSKRASGSGEHGEASPAASLSLDFSSGKAGSQLPTPRLMYSTSRGLSLQESGVELCDMLVRVQLEVSEDLERPVNISIVRRQDAPPADSTASQAANRLSRAAALKDSAPDTSAPGEDPPVAAQAAALPKPAVARQSPAAHQPAQLKQDPMQGSAFAEVAAAGVDDPDSGSSKDLRSQQGRAVTPGSAVQQEASEQHLQDPEAVSMAEASHQTGARALQLRAQVVEKEVHALLEPSTSNDSSLPAAKSSTTAADPSHESTLPASEQASAASLSDPGAQHAPSHSNVPPGTAATSDHDRADADPIAKPNLKGLNVAKPPAGSSKPSSTVATPTASSSRQHGAEPDQAALHSGGASDNEALSPSALSDSSEFGGRGQQGSGRDGHSHAGHVDWNELGKRSSRLAALAGTVSP